MRRAIHPLVVAAFAVLAACRPVEGTERPDDTTALEDLERTPPSSDDGAEATPAAPADKSKPVPKVRDRDPEEEKKKLALSRQRSAEAAKHLDAGRLVEAIDHSRQALKIHEQNVDAMLVMAEAYYRQKKFELVQAVTSSALAVDAKVRSPQETSRAHNLKGFAYSHMGQDNLATQSFKLAAEADEKNASAWNNLGTRYMQAGDIATAKQCFSYALELDPRFAKAHVNLGAAQRADGKVEDAEKSLQTALKLRPSYPEAYFNLGVLYLDAEPYPGLETIARLEKAISYLTKYRELAIADGPDGPTASTGKKGPRVSPGPASVSHARAEDYIRVAKKGIEREQRKIDRGKTRDDTKGSEPDPKPPKNPGAATPADAAPADGEADPDAPVTPTKPGGATPGAPTPVKPGQPKTPGGTAATPAAPTEPVAPTKPTPVKPGGTATPSTPSTPPPAAPTSKPTPTKPTPTTPAKPVEPAAPSKPAPTEPAPTEPAVKPSPTPPASPPASKPTPVQPAPVKPTPVQPAKPTAPAPGAPGVQKPGVQKPGGATPKSATWRNDGDDISRDRLAAWNPRLRADTHADAHGSRPACATMTSQRDRMSEAKT